jgi:hypothetical protein
MKVKANIIKMVCLGVNPDWKDRGSFLKPFDSNRDIMCLSNKIGSITKKKAQPIILHSFNGLVRMKQFGEKSTIG